MHLNLGNFTIYASEEYPYMMMVHQVCKFSSKLEELYIYTGVHCTVFTYAKNLRMQLLLIRNLDCCAGKMQASPPRY